MTNPIKKEYFHSGVWGPASASAVTILTAVGIAAVISAIVVLALRHYNLSFSIGALHSSLIPEVALYGTLVGGAGLLVIDEALIGWKRTKSRVFKEKAVPLFEEEVKNFLHNDGSQKIAEISRKDADYHDYGKKEFSLICKVYKDKKGTVHQDVHYFGPTGNPRHQKAMEYWSPLVHQGFTLRVTN